MVLWGIATACTAAAKDYHTLLAARIFLGIFEAPVAPALMLISSQWYTTSEQSPRFAFWYCGLGVGQIVGGALSYAFQQIRDPEFQSWKILFVVLGCLTVLLGVFTIFTLPDSPMSARFLSDAEKTALLHHIASNRTGILNTRFQPSQILAALADVQLWLLVLMTILVSAKETLQRLYSDLITAEHLFRRCHVVFRYLDQGFRLLPTSSSSAEHAIWRNLDREQLDRGLWSPSYFKSLALVRRLLRSRHYGRCAYELPSEGQQVRFTCWHLPGELHRSDSNDHVSIYCR